MKIQLPELFQCVGWDALDPIRGREFGYRVWADCVCMTHYSIDNVGITAGVRETTYHRATGVQTEYVRI